MQYFFDMLIIYNLFKKHMDKNMNKKVLLYLISFCFFISSINGLESQEIKDLAQRYVILKKLKQNTLKSQLIIAVRMRKNKAFFVDLVIKKGADINAIDLQGKTALIHTVIEKDYETTKILLELKASISIKDIYGKTALDYAYEYNDKQIIQLLESFL